MSHDAPKVFFQVSLKSLRNNIAANIAVPILSELLHHANRIEGQFNVSKLFSSVRH